jgi:alanine dehydrogenase
LAHALQTGPIERADVLHFFDVVFQFRLGHVKMADSKLHQMGVKTDVVVQRVLINPEDDPILSIT